MSITWVHQGFPCPVCRTDLNASTTINALEPMTEGDLTLCAECGALLTYVGKPPVALRILTQPEIDALPEQDRAALQTAERERAKYRRHKT